MTLSMTDSLPPEVTEIAMVSTNAVGYFAQPEHADDLDHGKRGAYGQWSAINEDNTTDDFVHFGRCAKPWNGGGGFTWSIPNAWRVAGDPFATNVFTRTDQRFELDADGTARVSKFGWTGERGTNDTHRVYGGGRADEIQVRNSCSAFGLCVLWRHYNEQSAFAVEERVGQGLNCGF